MNSRNVFNWSNYLSLFYCVAVFEWQFLELHTQHHFDHVCRSSRVSFSLTEYRLGLARICARLVHLLGLFIHWKLAFLGQKLCTFFCKITRILDEVWSWKPEAKSGNSWSAIISPPEIIRDQQDWRQWIEIGNAFFYVLSLISAELRLSIKTSMFLEAWK